MRYGRVAQDRPWDSFGAALACLSKDRTWPPRANLEPKRVLSAELSSHCAPKPNEGVAGRSCCSNGRSIAAGTLKPMNYNAFSWAFLLFYQYFYKRR